MTEKMGYVRYVGSNVASKVISVRMLLVCVIQLVFHDLYVHGILQLAKQYDEKVSPVLFPLMCGGLVFIMIFAFCVMYMYSEVPFMNQKEMYCIIRTGRYKWLSAQEITITILAFCLVVFSYVIDIVRLFPRISFADKWDRILVSLSYGTISAEGVHLEMDLLQMYSPWNLFLYGTVMGFLVVNLVGHLVYTISLRFHRAVAVVVASVLALMPIVTYNTSNFFAFVYYVSPFSWISPGYLVRSISIPDITYKAGACVIGTVVCVILDYLIMKKKDFDWNMEE